MNHEQQCEKIKEIILHYIKKNGDGTVAEVERECQEQIDVKGDYCLEYPKPNIFLWFGYSLAFVTVIIKLIEENEVLVKSTSSFIYLINGRVPNVCTVGEILPKNGHKKARWLPIILIHPDRERSK